MSELAFAELEMQVETLPVFQMLLLKKKIESILAQQDDSFEFDTLVSHTERADNADEYIRSFRDTDRF
ncbi:MAG: hypothetical protein J6S91_13095 [Treponema sp.]|nr:hypothetical protein [Treponema sp.]